jgi:hypothetical protein
MKLKNFILVDDTGGKAVVMATDEKSAKNAWEYAHPGIKVVSVKEDTPC